MALRLDVVTRFAPPVRALVRVALTDNQFAALVSFAYNVGRDAFTRSTLLERLNAGEYGAVPEELRKWTKARVDGKLVELDGLKRRRRRNHSPARSARELRPGILAVNIDNGSGAACATLRILRSGSRPS